MEKLLHIIATPRGNESRTLKVSEAFLKKLKEKYPTCEVDELNLFTSPLAQLTVKRIDGKYTLLSGKELDGELKEAWREIELYIKRFLSADFYVLSVPMWNFSIPYALKHYIDIIVQPNYLFRYTEKGPEGFLKDKKMVIITSRGGDYGEGSPFRPYDLQEPYLRTIFGFVGIKDITFIHAQPMDALGPHVQGEKIKEAQGRAIEIAGGF